MNTNESLLFLIEFSSLNFISLLLVTSIETSNEAVGRILTAVQAVKVVAYLFSLSHCVYTQRCAPPYRTVINTIQSTHYKLLVIVLQGMFYAYPPKLTNELHVYVMVKILLSLAWLDSLSSMAHFTKIMLKEHFVKGYLCTLKKDQ